LDWTYQKPFDSERRRELLPFPISIEETSPFLFGFKRAVEDDFGAVFAFLETKNDKTNVAKKKIERVAKILFNDSFFIFHFPVALYEYENEGRHKNQRNQNEIDRDGSCHLGDKFGGVAYLV